MKVLIIAIFWMATQSLFAAGISIDPTTGIDAGGNPVTGLSTPQAPNDAATKAYVDALEARITALEALLEHFTRSDNEIYITGANLHIRSGGNWTHFTPNGLGNLIVGYDESRLSGALSCSLGAYTTEPDCTNAGKTWARNHKSGSHNVVIGAQHNYSQFSGMVTGYHNTISGPYSSVSGGSNTASQHFSSVSGGLGNTASGEHSSVSGGFLNIASGDKSSVSGGLGNTASGLYASVSGGQNNTASGDYSSVSGGGSDDPNFGNEAYANHSSILGGIYNITGDIGSGDPTIGSRATISGGDTNIAVGVSSTVAGGVSNEATHIRSTITGAMTQSHTETLDIPIQVITHLRQWVRIQKRPRAHRQR